MPVPRKVIEQLFQLNSFFVCEFFSNNKNADFAFGLFSDRGIKAVDMNFLGILMTTIFMCSVRCAKGVFSGGERQTDRQTYRQIDRQTDRQTNRAGGIYLYRKTDRHTQRENVSTVSV